MEPDFDEFLSKGILFHENAKILLAEKFVNVEFLIPFPHCNFTAKEAIEETLHKLSNMWNIPSVFCPLDFSSQFNTSTDQFKVNWPKDKIQSETHEAEQTVKNLRATTSKHLAENPDKSARDRRGEPVVAAAALNGIGLFGSGVAMGSYGCVLSGIFGLCQENGRKNAENIDRLNEYASLLTDYVLEVESESNEKFFMISNELAEISKIQKTMQETQNKNWEIMEEQFEVFQHNFYVLRDCNQVFFSNQQLNFNFDNIASLLSVLYADIKSYRSALYAYNINILNSIPILLNQRLPMSLVPHESLLAILDSVYDAQKMASNRLTLAIPMQDLLSYYDSKLIREVSTVDQGLLLTLAIPLASS